VHAANAIEHRPNVQDFAARWGAEWVARGFADERRDHGDDAARERLQVITTLERERKATFTQLIGERHE
jgi:hypothetical protein